MTVYAAHLAGGCLDNTADPGWCVWCGQKLPPAGDAPAETPAPPPGPPPPLLFRDVAGFARFLELLGKGDGAGGGAS